MEWSLKLLPTQNTLWFYELCRKMGAVAIGLNPSDICRSFFFPVKKLSRDIKKEQWGPIHTLRNVSWMFFGFWGFFWLNRAFFSMWNVVSVRIWFSMEMFGMPGLILQLLKPNQNIALCDPKPNHPCPQVRWVKLFSFFLWEYPQWDWPQTNRDFPFLPHLHSRGATRAGFIQFAEAPGVPLHTPTFPPSFCHGFASQQWDYD